MIGFIGGIGLGPEVVEVVRHIGEVAAVMQRVLSEQLAPVRAVQSFVTQPGRKAPGRSEIRLADTAESAGPDPADLRCELGDLRSCRVGESPLSPLRDADQPVQSQRVDPTAPHPYRGITSASTASRAFASNLVEGFQLDVGDWVIIVIALAFMALVAIVNFRGVGESVKANVVLTCVELSGLLLVILVGFFAVFGGDADFSRVVAFDTPEDKGIFLAVTTATSLAFFAMVGFEDSVNMAEETKDPVRIFPKVMLTGLTITGVIYVPISIVSVALVPVGQLAESETPLVEVVKAGAPGLPIDTLLPFISMFAVANSALINMLMASRLIYGMARQRVLPPVLGKVHPTRRTPWTAIVFTTLLAFALITVVSLTDPDSLQTLGGTTALLLLAVFAVVNVAVLVLRRDKPKGALRS